MTPEKVMQTKFGEEGNCLLACIAGFLHIEVDSIPKLWEPYAPFEEWYVNLNKWLEPYGFIYFEADLNEESKSLSECFGFHIMCGMTRRSTEYGHAVIAYKGKVWHDPHPSCDPFIEDLGISYGFLIPRWEEKEEAQTSHHIFCNHTDTPAEECKQCKSLNAEYPLVEGEEPVAKYFPKAVSLLNFATFNKLKIEDLFRNIG